MVYIAGKGDFLCFALCTETLMVKFAQILRITLQIKLDSCRYLHRSIGQTSKECLKVFMGSRLPLGTNLACCSLCYFYLSSKSTPSVNQNKPHKDARGDVFGARSSLVFRLSQTVVVNGDV